MVWFAVDDTFHTHPKRIAAGNAAVGLWTACGSHCGQHLTDGHIPGGVAKLYGRPADIKALVRVRLWHGPDHDCERCPQPGPGAYVMHDYLEYNPSREEVQDERRRTHEAKSRAGRAGGIASGVTRRRNGRTEADAKQNGSRAEAEPEADPKQTRSRTEAERKQNPPPLLEARGKQSEAPSRPDPARPEGTAGEGGETPLPKADAREHGPGGDAPPDPDADPLTRLVAEVQAIRPTWTDHAIRAAARRCTDAGRTTGDTRHALLDVAGRADTTAPGRATADGPWWPGPPTPSPPPVAERLRGTPPLDPERNRRGLALVRQALTDPAQTPAAEEAS